MWASTDSPHSLTLLWQICSKKKLTIFRMVLSTVRLKVCEYSLTYYRSDIKGDCLLTKLEKRLLSHLERYPVLKKLACQWKVDLLAIAVPWLQSIVHADQEYYQVLYQYSEIVEYHPNTPRNLIKEDIMGHKKEINSVWLASPTSFHSIRRTWSATLAIFSGFWVNIYPEFILPFFSSLQMFMLWSSRWSKYWSER
jgi:hypothetical protein